jgi:hypothetical protein
MQSLEYMPNNQLQVLTMMVVVIYVEFTKSIQRGNLGYYIRYVKIVGPITLCLMFKLFITCGFRMDGICISWNYTLLIKSMWLINV